MAESTETSRKTCLGGSPCGDPTCYRGAIGDWNYQYKDGPCKAQDCAWPEGLPARPHFTDTPATPIVDAGKAALKDIRNLLYGHKAK